MGGMDQVPARVDRQVIQQALDRALPGVGQAILHLLGLLGNVDMHWQLARAGPGRQFGHGGQASRAQGVDRQPQVHAGQAPAGGLYITNQPHQGIGRRGKAALVFAQTRCTKAGAHVQGRQQSQAHADPLGRAHQRQ